MRFSHLCHSRFISLLKLLEPGATLKYFSAASLRLKNFLASSPVGTIPEAILNAERAKTQKSIFKCGRFNEFFPVVPAWMNASLLPPLENSLVHVDQDESAGRARVRVIVIGGRGIWNWRGRGKMRG